MKKIYTLSFLFLLGIIFSDNYLYSKNLTPWKISTRRTKKFKNPIKKVNLLSSVNEGRVIYNKECLSCHGKTGLGDGPSASQLVVPSTNLRKTDFHSQSDAVIFAKIRYGRRPMPGYKRLGNTKIWHLVNFIRTLKDSK